MGRMEPPRPVPRRSRRARRPGPGILAKAVGAVLLLLALAVLPLSLGVRGAGAATVGDQIAADPATGGYWLVAGDGGIFSFGAPDYGAG